MSESDASKADPENFGDLSYDPDTGLFVWLVSPRCSRVIAGDAAGCWGKDGYLKITYKGKRYFAHRLAWFIVHGGWSIGQIDHIDGDRGNNRIENLRDVSHTLNQQNRRNASRNSTSGLLGAHKCRGKWYAKIGIDGKQKYLGTFATKEAAHAEYLNAKRALHPEACHDHHVIMRGSA